MNKLVSIVIPTLNEEKNIRTVLTEVKNFMKERRIQA